MLKWLRRISKKKTNKYATKLRREVVKTEGSREGSRQRTAETKNKQEVRRKRMAEDRKIEMVVLIETRTKASGRKTAGETEK